MTVTIRAHFDGKAIVPDEAVMLPRDTPLMVHVDAPSAAPPTESQRAHVAAAIARWRQVRGDLRLGVKAKEFVNEGRP